MMLPAQAVVDERNGLLLRLQGSDGTSDDLMSLVAQPPGMFHDARRIISESSLTLGGWIDRYSRDPDTPRATTSQHIADCISAYYRHLGHASVITLDDLRRYGLNVDHMNNHPEVQEFCMTAFHAAQVAFMLTDTVKVVRCHTDATNGVGTPDNPTNRSDTGIVLNAAVARHRGLCLAYLPAATKARHNARAAPATV